MLISSGHYPSVGTYVILHAYIIFSLAPHQVQPWVVTCQCLVNCLSLRNGLALPSVALLLSPPPTVRPCTTYSLVTAHTMEEIGGQCMYIYMYVVCSNHTYLLPVVVYTILTPDEVHTCTYSRSCVILCYICIRRTHCHLSSDQHVSVCALWCLPFAQTLQHDGRNNNRSYCIHELEVTL